MKKILILSANPKDTNKLRLDEEVREIQAALERSRAREEFELITRWAVRIDDLRRALLDNEPQIVHFSGHATKNNGVDSKNNYEQHQRNAVRLNSQSGGIALENNSGQMQLVSTNSLATLFELCKDTIECVLLNACYSEAQAEAIYQHIDCVIGMERAITDKAAINFSVAFYDALGAGRNYKDAFEFGRNNIDLNGIPESLTPKIKIRNNSKTLFISNSKEKKAKMAGDRTINMGSGNYNERIEGDYIQGNQNQQNMKNKTSNFDLKGAQFAGGLVDAETVNANQIGGNITNYTPEQRQNLVEAAKEIEALLQHLQQTYPTTTSAEKMTVVAKAVDEIEKNPTLKARVIGALKSGGTEALKELVDHPLINILLASIEGWQEAV
ncbi:CHAT domain-containing protein [Fischerella sp. PCC 9605]|uniref:CHAT domain-containing protein n=1 Tax=Fischerella sp. PCC 9605 TaxID=1173024 RepID=UPI0004B7D473|nr:CHAT domain-containing protein [Fischerella sp. PCC 9605]